MNGLSYLRTIEGRRWCQHDILCCPNGEKGSDPYGANNFTFGSAKYVAAITEEVQKTFPVARSYVGGHSQGGFLTFSVIMHYPKLFQGAFPMAGDCWSQNEPNLWETKPEIMAQQKEIAIAVIHGQSDPVVKFSQGQHAYDVFEVMGYPRLRLFAPEKLGHQFGLSPVDKALEWLDAMVGDDDLARMKLAKTWVKEGEWGWVVQASKAVVAKKKVSSRAKKSAISALKLAEKAAAEPTKEMTAAMKSGPAAEWVPQWYAYRHQFGWTKAAAKLVKRYDSNAR